LQGAIFNECGLWSFFATNGENAGVILVFKMRMNASFMPQPRSKNRRAGRRGRKSLALAAGRRRTGHEDMDAKIDERQSSRKKVDEARKKTLFFTAIGGNVSPWL
jgi:hypothetical protein